MRLDPAVAATRVAVRRSLKDLPRPALVLAAVSGGPDSTALAAALAFVAPRSQLHAGAVVVDHGRQAGSANRAEQAAGRCRDLGLDPVVVARVAVGTAGGPEAAARTARYRALDGIVERLGASSVLLGHTRDDQAETVLLRLARGSGARALAAMPAVRGRYRRPFLGLRRATTLAACEAQRLEAEVDPENADPAYRRVRVRTQLLPALEVALGPGVALALARSADLLRDDADALDGWAAEVLAASDPLDADRLAALPRAVRTRVLRAVVLAAGAPAGALTADHTASLDRLISDWHGQGPVTLPGGLVAFRRCGRLRVDERAAESRGPGRSGCRTG